MSSPSLALSVVAPAHNEEENIRSFVNELARVLESTAESFEVIVVDDGSTDDTQGVLRSLMPDRPWLRTLAMRNTPPGRGHGQSAALGAGIVASRGRLVVTIDADLQMDPADLPSMLEAMEREDADLVHGDRSANRRDALGRRIASWIGRTTRRLLVADDIRDTGCSLKVMTREVAERLPLEFRGMHRFIGVIARQMGYRVIEVPVRHRPRVAGRAKYGLFDRAVPGLIDCFVVRWMRHRWRTSEGEELSIPGKAKRPGADEIHSAPAPV